MATDSQEVRDRAISGLRWGMLLNLLSTPMAVVINIVLGQTSPIALGYYSAVQVFAGGFQTFFFLGGRQAFTRFVPRLSAGDRWSFLCTYTALVVAVVVAVSLLALTVLEGPAAWLMNRFGAPPMPLTIGMMFLLSLMGIALHFLYGVLEAPRATLTSKLATAGFLTAALLGVTVFRPRLLADPASFMWLAALLVYGAGCLLGLWNVGRVTAGQVARPRWLLPRGFWSVAFFAQFQTLVTFVYQLLSPSIVLVSLDVKSLAVLHSALRYNVLLRIIPTLFADVLAPGLSRLDAAGSSEVASRQARAALKTTCLVTVPVTLALILFAGDALAIFNPGFREHRDVLRIAAVASVADPLVLVGGGMVAAFGLFRAYLIGSVVFVVAATALALLLIPPLGLIGAALATTLAALVQFGAVAIVLRGGIGFRPPVRLYVAWAVSGAACLCALWWDPPRVTAAGLYVAALAVFVVGGGVRRHELRGLHDKLLRGK